MIRMDIRGGKYLNIFKYPNICHNMVPTTKWSQIQIADLEVSDKMVRPLTPLLFLLVAVNIIFKTIIYTTRSLGALRAPTSS